MTKSETAVRTSWTVAVPWRLLLVPVIAVNFGFVALYVAQILAGADALDFASYREATTRFDDTLYRAGPWWYGWRYSPVAVFPLALVVWIGEWGWRLLILGAALTLPGWRRWVLILSAPFWFDVLAGNVMTFVVVAAYWALRGNRWAIGLFLVMALLIPRPLMVPIVAWILWHRREWVAPFAVAFVVHAAAVVAFGHTHWFATLVSMNRVGGDVGSVVNFGPTGLIGLWWMVAALPLAAWAFWSGYPATSGLLLQPYWLPYYLMMPLADDLRHH